MVIFDRLEINTSGDKLFIDAHVSESPLYKNWTITGVYIVSGDNYTTQFSEDKAYRVLDTKFTLNAYQDTDYLGYIVLPEYFYRDSSLTYPITILNIRNQLKNEQWEVKSINEKTICLRIDNADIFFKWSECFTDIQDVTNINKFKYTNTPPIQKLNLVVTPEDIKSYVNGFSNDLFFIYVFLNPASNDCDKCLPCGADEPVVGVTFDTGILYNKGLGYIEELSNSCSVPQGFTDFILNWEGFKIYLESEHYIEAIEMFKKLFLNKATTTVNNNCGCYGKLSV